jgi:hypothetical protein
MSVLSFRGLDNGVKGRGFYLLFFFWGCKKFHINKKIIRTVKNPIIQSIPINLLIKEII